MKQAQEVGSGFNLIVTRDWIGGRRYVGYVLTDEGREAVREFMETASGEALTGFDPLTVEKLFEALAGRTRS